MALTVDQANIYTGAGVGQVNHTGSTTATVAAGAMIVIMMFRFRSGGGGTYAGTGGGLTWSSVASSSSGNILIQMFAAFAPSGLASGTGSFGVTGTGNQDYTVAAASYLGVDTSSTVAAATRATNTTAAGTTGWSSGTVAGNADDGYIAMAGGDSGTLRTSTATNGTERIDFNSATSSGSITLTDKISGAGANEALTGDWSPGTFTHVALGAAFIPSGGAAAVPTLGKSFVAIPFMK